MLKKTVLAFVLMSALISRTALAQQTASVIDSNPPRVKVEEVTLFEGQGIPFLGWSKETYLVETTPFANYVNLSGRFKEKIVSATVNGRTLAFNEAGFFIVRLEFTGEEKSFILTVTDSKNKVYRMQYKTSLTTPKVMQTVAGLKPFRWRFSAGAGFTIISYRQFDTVSTVFEQKVVTVKGGVIYKAVPDKLDLGFSAFFNLLPLTSTSLDGYKIQYLGLNLRAGYHVVDAPSSLRFTINGGVYFNNSYGTVGFTNMFGPQISPEFIYVFENGNSLFWYGKYAYSLSGSKGISLKDNREVAAGVHYSFPISPSNRLSIGIDVSQLSLSLSDAWASTNTYSLSGGISF